MSHDANRSQPAVEVTRPVRLPTGAADQESSVPVQRKSLPGHSKTDKHRVVKTGEPITSPHLIGKWSPR